MGRLRNSNKMGTDKEKQGEFGLIPIERIVYIWARYEGTRDASKEGKHYSKSDIEELIRRLVRYKDDTTSFYEGFEKNEEGDFR